MNVLITGQTGFLGRSVVEYFNKQKGVNLYGVSRSSNSHIECPQYVLDIMDNNKLKQLMAEKTIDVVIHLSGKAIVSECESAPYEAFMTNGLGTASVLEAARNAGVKRIISVETDKVYGIQEHLPTDETDVLNPGTPYELSKVLAAQFADFYRQYYNMDIISVRPANLIGGNDFNTSRILPASFRAISEGKGIPVYSNAVDMKRDFVYVKDVARALWLLASENPKYNVYNISSNNEINILDFANKITDVTGHDVRPVIIKKKTEFKEIPQQSIDGHRFTNEFKFTFTSLSDIIKESYEEFKGL